MLFEMIVIMCLELKEVLATNCEVLITEIIIPLLERNVIFIILSLVRHRRTQGACFKGVYEGDRERVCVINDSCYNLR